MKETVTLNTQDQKRVLVLNQILDGQVSTAEAAALLKLSKRQMQRILAAYRKEGAAALVHGNRGRHPKHRISEETRQQILKLAQTTYVGANQQVRCNGRPSRGRDERAENENRDSRRV